MNPSSAIHISYTGVLGGYYMMYILLHLCITIIDSSLSNVYISLSGIVFTNNCQAYNTVAHYISLHAHGENMADS